MKSAWIDYSAERTECPMTYWVHRGPHGEHWCDSPATVPPLPGHVPGKGYPILHVEYNGFTFAFASIPELDTCIDVLSRRNLPSSLELSAERGSGAGPNGHWVSRLPARVTPWKYRQGAVDYLRKARREFADQLQAIQ